jgi:hypothetical protein
MRLSAINQTTLLNREVFNNAYETLTTIAPAPQQTRSRRHLPVSSNSLSSQIADRINQQPLREHLEENPWAFNFKKLDDLMEQKERTAKKLTNQILGTRY